MRVVAQRKTNAYKQTYADNQNISILPAIMSTSNRMHGEFLRLLFLQAHRETEAHFTAAGMPRLVNWLMILGKQYKGMYQMAISIENHLNRRWFLLLALKMKQ